MMIYSFMFEMGRRYREINSLPRAAQETMVASMDRMIAHFENPPARGAKIVPLFRDRKAARS